MTQLTDHSILRESRLPGVKLLSRGKVRDLYEVSSDLLLIVATDRLSAFDVVMDEGIPDKGRVLTELSCFWFELFRDAFESHFVTASLADYPAKLQPFQEQLIDRSMLVRKAEPFPIECIVRGYLSGSGWKDYQQSGMVCGIRLPAGLTESAKLDRPIFTPSTKAREGHDENISQADIVKRIGASAAEELASKSLALYSQSSEYAERRGIIIADTKFEWGLCEGKIILIDEVLTPDSSRFWPKDRYAPGKPQPSFDKQFVRDYLLSVGWNKQPPPPSLPPEVVEKTSQKYREAYRLLTGRTLNRIGV